MTKLSSKEKYENLSSVHSNLHTYRQAIRELIASGAPLPETIVILGNLLDSDIALLQAVLWGKDE